MPKPGGAGKKQSWSIHYADFQAPLSAADQRRVSFKPNREKNRQERSTNWGNSLRAHLEEEDVDMGTNAGNARYNNRRFVKGGKRGNRTGSPLPGGRVNNGKRKLMEGPISWYRVYLPYGNKYEKQFILQTMLNKIAPTPLIPIMWTPNGSSISFYVDDYKTADKLNNLDREVQLPDGFKLIVRVSSGAPTVDISPAIKEKMKLAMAKRYNSHTKALDLTRFHIDPELQDVFCALFRPIIMLAAIEIISENIPQIEAINFNDNKLQMLSHLRKLNEKLPKLKIIHLGSNKIRDINQLDNLSGLPITEVFLDGNPLCDRFKDQNHYVSELRKKFPKVIKLDGVELPPPISFDIEEEVHVPTSNQTFLCNPNGQEIVRQFLEQYFLIMDSDNRQPLLQAYHEQAVFSITIAYGYSQNPKNSPWLNWYNVDNRNLLRISDSERRAKLLKQGHLQVVAFLQEMPASKHDIHNFTVDLNLFTPQMLHLSVSGMFRELKSGHKNPPIRSFFRSLVIVPTGSGFCIANETLHISNASDQQMKVAFRTPVVAAPVQSGPDNNIKQQMLQAMSQESGMNLEWSQKCLEDTNWDFQRAGIVFTEAKNKGVIPPEAFIK